MTLDTYQRAIMLKVREKQQTYILQVIKVNQLRSLRIFSL